jgi:hypothetical protein
MIMSTNEIVWIDSVEDPFLVLTRPNDDAHYFYWPLEVTLGKWIIRKNDVEPVKTNTNLVISRFHFHALTVWINPPRHSIGNQTKPVVHFMRNFHTPAAATPNHTVRVFPVARAPNIGISQKLLYIAMRRVFKTYLRYRSDRANNPKGYWTRHVTAGPDFESFGADQLFDSDYVHRSIIEIILVGDPAEIAKIIGDIRKMDKGQLTPAALVSSLKF